MWALRPRRSISRVCALMLTLTLLCAQMPAMVLALPPMALAAPAPITFSARTPAAGSTVGMSDPDISLKALDTAGNHIESVVATIDGARVATSLTGSGSAEATASFPTYGLTTGTHAVSMTFVTDGGGTATDTWSFTVAPPQAHTLAYSAAAGGSIVGSSTQVVQSGTGSVELEGFESAGQWSGAQSADTVNVLHGPTSLKLTSGPGAPTYSHKDVSLDLTTAAPFRLYFYVAQDPKVAWPQVVLSFYTADRAGRLTATIVPERMEQGWNCITLTRSDFEAAGGATWSDAFESIELGVSSVVACSVSFDSLHKGTAEARPMVAITFDDGTQSAYEQGFKYMASKGLPGTMYVIPIAVGWNSDFVTLPELQTMYASGWDIASHTNGHTILTTVSQAQAETELTGARDWLVSQGFPRAATDVAYPYGSWNGTVLAAMAASGMRSGRTTDRGDNVIPLFKPYQIKASVPSSLAEAKVPVDRAIANHSLSVLGFHKFLAESDPEDPFTISDFQALIDYIRTRPVTVVQMSDVVERHSNDGFTVTAVPNEGHHFVGWSDGVKTATRRDTNVAAGITASATFATDTRTITASAGEGGSIDPAGVRSVQWGSDSETFTATPLAGYRFDRFTEGATPLPATPVGQGRYAYRFSSVTADRLLAASFVQTFTVTAQAGDGGAISPPGVLSVDRGATQAYTITPAAHHHVQDVNVDGTSKGPVTSYTFEGVTGPHTISATFATDTRTITASAGEGG
ncbi:MAG: polysaccharide deacetylase family protein, partial [Actinomycetes bacterium]